jgi:hypothetical protein
VIACDWSCVWRVFMDFPEEAEGRDLKRFAGAGVVGRGKAVSRSSSGCQPLNGPNWETVFVFFQ